MTTIKIPFKRGTTSQNDAYKGNSGEVTIDSTLRTLRVHDGIQMGGEPLLRLRDLELATESNDEAIAAAAAAAADALTASTSATSATASATAANTSKLAAASSATAAATSATASATSAAASLVSQNAAATSATNAATSATSATTAAASLLSTPTFASPVTAYSFIPSSSTLPSNGMYLPAANTVGWTTNGAEKMRLDATGILGLGHTSPSSYIGSGMLMYSTVTAGPHLMLWNGTNDAAGANISLRKSRAGNNVSSGDNLGIISATGWDGTSSYITAAQILTVVDGTNGAGIVPGRIGFSTFPDGGVITGLTGLVGGTGYTDGTYTAVRLTGGTGIAATADLTIAGGVVTVATLNAGGQEYRIAGVLTAPTSVIGAGTGFTINVLSISAPMAERMRIDSRGNIGVGTSALSASAMFLNRPITGAITAYGVQYSGTTAADVTASSYTYSSEVTVAASAETLTRLYHYTTYCPNWGARSVTEHVGYYAHTNLGSKGANNYGFRSVLMASANTNWNFYADGTAANLMAGQLIIGTGATQAGVGLYMNKVITGAVNAYGINVTASVQPDVTTSAASYSSMMSLAGAVLSTWYHYRSTQNSTGVGTTSSLGTQIGFSADSALIGARANYGFYSNLNVATALTISNVAVTSNVATVTTSATHFLSIGKVVTVAATTNTAVNGTVTVVAVPTPTTFTYAKVTANIAAVADTGTVLDTSTRYNSYNAGTAPNYFEGSIGVGVTPNSSYKLRVGGLITGATISAGIVSHGLVQSDVTNQAMAFSSFVGTQATAFTLPILSHFYAEGGALGAGSSITEQSGFKAANLTLATNNYGFHGAQPAATGRWNAYMAGSAQNYFLGNVGIGTGKSVPSVALDVNGTVSATLFTGPLTGAASANVLKTGDTITGALVIADASQVGTTVASNPILAVRSMASGRDAHIHMGDNVNAAVRLGYLNGAFYAYVNGAQRFGIATSGLASFTSDVTAAGQLTGSSGLFGNSGWLSQSYSVATATAVSINLVAGSTTLVNGMAYRIRLNTTSTGAVTGAVYIAYQTASGVWAVQAISKNSIAAGQHPQLQVSGAGTSLQVFHNNAATYTVQTFVESFNTGNVTILSKGFFGIDSAFSFEQSTGALTADSTVTSFAAPAVTVAGQTTTAALATGAPTTKTGAYTVLATDTSLILNGSASITLTLPNAVTYPGRWLYLKNIAAFTVISAGNNVVPQAGGAASSAIMAAAAGKWASLQSDGANWQIMMSN